MTEVIAKPLSIEITGSGSLLTDFRLTVEITLAY